MRESLFLGGQPEGSDKNQRIELLKGSLKEGARMLPVHVPQLEEELEQKASQPVPQNDPAT